MREARGAVVPGAAFGAGGEGHVRCSFAYAVDQIEEALDRIEGFLRRLPGFMPGAAPAGAIASEADGRLAGTPGARSVVSA